MPWESVLVIIVGAVVVTLIDHVVLGIALYSKHGFVRALMHVSMYMTLGVAIVNAHQIVARFLH